MNPARRSFLRDVMQMAWSLYRAELRGPSPRTFADALSGSWAWAKGRAARQAAAPQWAKGSHSRTLYTGSQVASPIRRSLTGQPYAYSRARTAGRATTSMGR